MPRLERARDGWESAGFAEELKAELSALPAGTIPLQSATRQGGIVDDSAIAVSVLSSDGDERRIESRVLVFFDEIVGGCNCHDDPVSAHSQCTLLVGIDRRTGEADFTVLDEP